MGAATQPTNGDSSADRLRGRHGALDAGLTTFDMADHYGSAEEIAVSFAAGRGTSSRPELLTKWVPPPGQLSKSDVRAAVERSLRRLRLPALDLLQFHAWNYADPSWLDALFWLRELRDEGLVRHLGLTKFDAAHLRIVVETGIPVVSNQVCFSLLDAPPRPPRPLPEARAEAARLWDGGRGFPHPSASWDDPSRTGSGFPPGRS